MFKRRKMLQVQKPTQNYITNIPFEVWEGGVRVLREMKPLSEPIQMQKIQPPKPITFSAPQIPKFVKIKRNEKLKKWKAPKESIIPKKVKLVDIANDFEEEIFTRYPPSYATRVFFEDVKVMKTLLSLPEKKFKKMIAKKRIFEEFIPGKTGKEIREQLRGIDEKQRNTLLDIFKKMSKRVYIVTKSGKVVCVHDYSKATKMITKDNTRKTLENWKCAGIIEARTFPYKK